LSKCESITNNAFRLDNWVYSSVFDWDEHNIGHIARHNVSVDEAEEAMTDPRRVHTDAYNTPFEERYAVIGNTSGERILFVMFTKRRGRFRGGMARDAKTI
jgi:uncharacterized protein